MSLRKSSQNIGYDIKKVVEVLSQTTVSRVIDSQQHQIVSQFLKETDFFSQFESEPRFNIMITQAFKRIQYVQYDQGTPIVSMGQRGDKIYFIIKGKVSVFTTRDQVSIQKQSQLQSDIKQMTEHLNILIKNDPYSELINALQFDIAQLEKEFQLIATPEETTDILRLQQKNDQFFKLNDICLINRICDIYEGGDFGELAIRDRDGQRKATVIAFENLDLAYLEQKDFLLIFQQLSQRFNIISKALKNLNSNLDEDIIDFLSEKFYEKKHQKGFFLFKESQKCQFVYIILEGTVEIFADINRQKGDRPLAIDFNKYSSSENEGYKQIQKYSQRVQVVIEQNIAILGTGQILGIENIEFGKSVNYHSFSAQIISEQAQFLMLQYEKFCHFMTLNDQVRQMFQNHGDKRNFLFENILDEIKEIHSQGPLAHGPQRKFSLLSLKQANEYKLKELPLQLQDSNQYCHYNIAIKMFQKQNMINEIQYHVDQEKIENQNMVNYQPKTTQNNLEQTQAECAAVQINAENGVTGAICQQGQIQPILSDSQNNKLYINLQENVVEDQILQQQMLEKETATAENKKAKQKQMKRLRDDTEKVDQLAMVNFDQQQRFNFTDNGDLEVMLGNEYNTTTSAQVQQIVSIQHDQFKDYKKELKPIDILVQHKLQKKSRPQLQRTKSQLKIGSMSPGTDNQFGSELLIDTFGEAVDSKKNLFLSLKQQSLPVIFSKFLEQSVFNQITDSSSNKQSLENSYQENKDANASQIDFNHNQGMINNLQPKKIAFDNLWTQKNHFKKKVIEKLALLQGKGKIFEEVFKNKQNASVIQSPQNCNLLNESSMNVLSPIVKNQSIFFKNQQSTFITEDKTIESSTLNTYSVLKNNKSQSDLTESQSSTHFLHFSQFLEQDTKSLNVSGIKQNVTLTNLDISHNEKTQCSENMYQSSPKSLLKPYFQNKLQSLTDISVVTNKLI